MIKECITVALLSFEVRAVYLGDTFVRRQYGPMITISAGVVLFRPLHSTFFKNV